MHVAHILSSRSAAAVALLTAGLFSHVACGDDPPRSPGAPSPGSATVRSVAIGGLESYGTFILPVEHPQLKATATMSNGTQQDCTETALWSVSPGGPLRVGPTAENPALRPGETIVGPPYPGESTVTAECGGVKAQRTIRVDFYTLRGRAVDEASGAPLAGAYFGQSGTVAGQADSDGRFELSELRAPETEVRVVWWGRVLQQTVAWNREPVMTVDFALGPQPMLLLTGSGWLCSSLPGERLTCGTPGHPTRFGAEYDVTVPRSGTLTLSGRWKIDSEEGGDILVEFSRGSQVLYSQGVREPGFDGKLFEVRAEPGTYRLTLLNRSRGKVDFYAQVLLR